ncbi:MAG: hypothetical protein K6G81_00615 [Lachnospiraceae bacterium]|nr:hypothetical protein [Lachnospiraceae bacterium]
MNEKMLYQVFDLQRFSPNTRLQAVIDATHARLETGELDDDELDMVAAAGISEIDDRNKGKQS